MVDVGPGPAGTDGRVHHQVEEGGNGRGPEQCSSPESGVGHARSGAADRAPEPTSHSHDPVDEKGPLSVDDGPRNEAMSKAIAVHPDTWEHRDRATATERTAAIDAGGHLELDWCEESVGGIHGPADGYSRRGVGGTVQSRAHTPLFHLNGEAGPTP